MGESQKNVFFIIGQPTFDEKTFLAKFNYRFASQIDSAGSTEPASSFDSTNPVGAIDFCETIQFVKPKSDFTFSENKREILNRALNFAAVIIGTSYYKTQPTKIILSSPLSDFELRLFQTIYQDGLSQFAFENHLTRADLGQFEIAATQESLVSASSPVKKSALPFNGHGVLALQSGGKDSILTATLLNEQQIPWTALYISSNEKTYPKVLTELGAEEIQVVIRKIDQEKLKLATEKGGLNGHVPVTYINMSIALIQAILNNDDTILTSIGHEGAEAHAVIKSPENSGLKDLPVNHQWSKTWEAEQLFSQYLTRYISANLKIGSILRKYSELKIAELFAEKCWKKYGHQFSSCNQANYKQGNDNSNLTWCGECAKCANSYLLFAPFLPAPELNSLFPAKKSLFEKPELMPTFKGLLGIDGAMKPFECIGEVAELRKAYHLKGKDYPDLPFSVPESDFDINKEYPSQF